MDSDSASGVPADAGAGATSEKGEPRPAQPAATKWARGSGHHIGREDALRRMNAALEAQARAIGQALHDETGQTLTAAYNSLAEAIEVAPPTVQGHLAAVKRHLEVIEAQLRRVAHELRPRILDDLGLVPALRFLATGMSVRPGITVTLALKVHRRIPAAVETAVYRLVQESFTNISRHANATRVLLEVAEWPGALRCVVSDNGAGFERTERLASGLGLVGIRDRLDALGAQFTIRSAPGQGTELMAIIPLEKRNGGSHPDGRRSSSRAGRVSRNPRTG